MVLLSLNLVTKLILEKELSNILFEIIMNESNHLRQLQKGVNFEDDLHIGIIHTSLNSY